MTITRYTLFEFSVPFFCRFQKEQKKRSSTKKKMVEPATMTTKQVWDNIYLAAAAK
jgi:hypothetical protein